VKENIYGSIRNGQENKKAHQAGLGTVASFFKVSSRSCMERLQLSLFFILMVCLIPFSSSEIQLGECFAISVNAGAVR
jgi:hypothetical protein